MVIEVSRKVSQGQYCRAALRKMRPEQTVSGISSGRASRQMAALPPTQQPEAL